MKSAIGIVFARLGGILGFMAALILANLVYPYIPSRLFTDIVVFFNNSTDIIVVMALLFMLGELFTLFYFPYDLPGPIFTGFGSLLLISFMFSMLSALETALKLGTFNFVMWFSYVLYPCVFGVVIVIGYFGIFTRAIHKDEYIEIETPSTWQVVGGEFRLLALDSVKWLRGLFKPSKKNKNQAKP